MSQEPYDTIIIGGGPAGAAAAVYAARKKMKTLVITDTFGGQAIVSTTIENWIGEERLTGLELAERLEKHVRSQRGIEVMVSEKATAVAQAPGGTFEVMTGNGGTHQTNTLIVATGARHRTLNVSGEEKFNGKGVAYCSTCDAPLFQDLDVAVVGSGNSALETVVDLFPYAKTIYLLIRSDELKGDAVTVEKVTNSPQVRIIRHAEVQEILGEQMVTGLVYRDKKSAEMKELAVSGVFVAIGSVPISEFVKELVETNEAGEIVVDHQTAQTSRQGIFAAGDVTNDPFKQYNIAAGDGVRAALSAYSYLLKAKKCSPCAEKEDVA